MKKKIIALFLLVATLVGVLASCGYSYSEDDMGAYVTMQKDALVKALKNDGLKIEDALFTSNEETRQKQVSDAIITVLANLNKTQRKSGKADGNDVVYYYYFIVDGDPASYTTPEALAAHTYIAYNTEKNTSLMTGTASNVVLGLNEIEDDSFTKAFYDAWAAKDFEFIQSADAVKDDEKTPDVDESKDAVVGNIYKIINSSSTTEEKKTKVTRTDIIYVTYTKKWTVKDSSGNTAEKKETYTDIRLWDTNHLDDTKDAADPFFKNFIDKTVGTVADFKVDVGEGDDKITYNYSGVRINAIHKTPKTTAADKTFGAPIVIKYNPYIEGSQTKLTAVDGSTIELKADKDLTYFIYPAYYTDTKDSAKLTAQEVIEDLFGKSVTADMFSEDALKYKGKVGDVEKTLEEIIKGKSDSTDAAWKEDLKTVYSYITDATKHADYDKNKDGKKDSANKPEKNSKEEIKARYEGYVKTRMEYLTALTNGKTAEGEKKTAAEILLAEYRQYTYDKLEDEYYTEIEHNVQHAIVKFIKSLEIKTLPEDAVDEIYEVLFENEKYYFNEQKDEDKSSATYNKEWYAIYNGDFDAYFIAKFAKGKTMADAEAALRKNAEAFVALSVKIYFAAEAFDVKIADDEYNDLYADNYGEQGAKLAAQFDKLMDHLLLMSGEKAFFEKEENAGKTYDRQLDDNGNIKYENIKYVIDEPVTE